MANFRYDNDPDQPNQFSNHADNWNAPTATRQVSVIAYLNDVDLGGETEFTGLGLEIKPVKGSILLFPSNFLYMHKGKEPLSNNKYIIVTWVHFDHDRLAYRAQRF